MARSRRIVRDHAGFRRKHKKPVTRGVPAFGLPRPRGFRPNRSPAQRSGLDQYRRWRLVTSRDMRRIWRFTAAAALRLRSWVGFS